MIAQSLLSPIFWTEGARALDQEACADGCGFLYMTRAGIALAHQLRHVLRTGELQDSFADVPPPRRFAKNDHKPVLIVAGKGNNGGDALVLARQLLKEHTPYRLILLTEPQQLRGDAARAWSLYEQSGGNVWSVPENAAWLSLDPAEYSLVVDAIFGTGQRLPVEGLYAEAIEWIQRSGLPVFSVDVPSGDLSATWTVVLGHARTDCFFLPRARHYGQWVVVPLGYPIELVGAHCWSGVFTIQKTKLATVLPARDPWKTKRGHGVAAIVAGSRRMTGAAVLCAEACMRSGVGMTYLACEESDLDSLAAQLREVVFCDRGEGLDALLSHVQAACVGPGIGRSGDAGSLVERCLSRKEIAWVVDADALNLLAGRLHLLKGFRTAPVLTPHEGEWQRLFGELPEAAEERVARVRDRAMELECVLVLKGPLTMIALPDGRVCLHGAPNAARAKAGSGDVLSGILVALLAQGLDPGTAAVLGGAVHARAAYRCAAALGARASLPSDYIRFLPEVWRELE